MSDSPGSNEHMGWERIWRSSDIPPRYRSMAAPNATVVEWAETLPSGGFVLDIGCGVGRHCLYLGRQGFRVAGIDISPTGVKTTAELCAEQQIPFDGHVSNLTSLPWSDATFDGAFSIASIHHQFRADLVQSLKEVFRVLKPGGLLLADFPSTETLPYETSREKVANGELTEPEPNTFIDIRPQISDIDDEYLPHHFCDEADLRDLLKSFEIVRLWADLRPAEGRPGKVGKWVVQARRPVEV